MTTAGAAPLSPPLATKRQDRHRLGPPLGSCHPQFAQLGTASPDCTTSFPAAVPSPAAPTRQPACFEPEPSSGPRPLQPIGNRPERASSVLASSAACGRSSLAPPMAPAGSSRHRVSPHLCWLVGMVHYQAGLFSGSEERELLQNAAAMMARLATPQLTTFLKAARIDV
ncbi:hypothetical protein NDU88_009662 [Pleurodeles waltl]|uniref:Uncharacterized protein n=1 Tax=Pleurodeles waltl TaxID=8319 RepID=A0AAV7PTG1_PLEWA|nr:hypothetical protein NDU88_009662 [Pleurodeles waltl]